MAKYTRYTTGSFDSTQKAWTFTSSHLRADGNKISGSIPSETTLPTTGSSPSVFDSRLTPRKVGNLLGLAQPYTLTSSHETVWTRGTQSNTTLFTMSGINFLTSSGGSPIPGNDMFAGANSTMINIVDVINKSQIAEGLPIITSPSEILVPTLNKEITEPTTSVIVGLDSSGSYRIYSTQSMGAPTNTTFLYASSSGKIGIFTETPTDDFHVVGDIKATDYKNSSGTSIDANVFIPDTLVTKSRETPQVFYHDGSITASGDISSSEYVYAKNIKAGEGSVHISGSSGSISASGALTASSISSSTYVSGSTGSFNYINSTSNISASGNIYGKQFYVEDQLAISTTDSTLTGYVFVNNNTTKVEIGKAGANESVNITGHITASGDISASKTLYALSASLAEDLEVRHITASCITSSCIIKVQDVHVEGVAIGTTYATLASPTFTGNVTASGEISSSLSIKALKMSVPGIADLETAIDANTAKVSYTDGDTVANLAAFNEENITAFSKTLLDDANASAWLTTLGLEGQEEGGDNEKSPKEGSSDLVTAGAINAGSITSGFTSIDVGSGDVKTTGRLEGGNVTASGEISASGEIKGLAGYTEHKITPTVVGSGKGDIVRFGGTTSMTAGKIYHYKSDGTWELADCNTIATCDGLLGVALGDKSDEDGMLLRGMCTLHTIDGTEAVGDILYLSEDTTGNANMAAPSATNDVVRIIGYCLHATNKTIWFSPDNSWLELS